MKKLTYLLAGSAFAAASANAEIVLTDDLSAYGYIDAAYVSTDDVEHIDGSVAEFELGFAFAPVESPWSAVAELSFRDGRTVRTQDVDEDGDNVTPESFSTGVDDLDFETVVITYAYSDELSFTVGNILSYQGFETYDATGLYQFSAQGLGGGYVYSAAYAFGASADYATDEFGAGLWVGETDDDLSYEIFLQSTAVEGLTATLVYADDPGYETLNLWASYEIDAFTFAVEYTDNDNDGGLDADANETALMFMGYYGFGDAGITVRYTDGELFDGTEYDRFTISPSYAFSDNVLGLLEWSVDDVDGGSDDTQLAAEILFTF